jgi:hypothetical protein
MPNSIATLPLKMMKHESGKMKYDFRLPDQSP